jgi:hypothetical protein
LESTLDVTTNTNVVGSLLIISVLHIAVVVIIVLVVHIVVTSVITIGNFIIVLWYLDAVNTSNTRRWGMISIIRTSNCAFIWETIIVKCFYILAISIVVWGLFYPWFICSPNLASKCLEDTIIIIAIIIITTIIISLAPCFLPIVVGVWILGEDVVIVPAH